MASASTDRDTPYRAAVLYRERLHLSWWLWAGALGLTALLAAEIWMGTSGARAWLPFTVLLPLTAGGLWWLGRIPIRVTTDELRVDDARLPLRYVADVVALDADGRRELLGVAADPLAFVIQRPWIGGAVQIVLDDPADPTPYWVISSRHPIELAAAIESRGGGSRGGGSGGRGSASGRADPEG